MSPAKPSWPKLPFWSLSALPILLLWPSHVLGEGDETPNEYEVPALAQENSPPKAILVDLPRSDRNLWTNAPKRVIQEVACVRFEDALQSIKYTFTLANPQICRFWVRKLARHQWDDQFTWKIDDEEPTSHTSHQRGRTDWLRGIIDVWYWARLGAKYLEAGKHTLEISSAGSGRRSIRHMAFDKLVIAFSDDMAKETWLSTNFKEVEKRRELLAAQAHKGVHGAKPVKPKTKWPVSDLAEALKRRPRFTLAPTTKSLVIECESFDHITGGVIECGASGGKAVEHTESYLRDLVLVNVTHEVEVEPWMRVWMDSKNFCQGLAIEEFWHGAYLEIDAQIHGAAYAVNEKRWFWFRCPKKTLKPGTHVLGVSMKGKPAIFDRIVLYTGSKPEDEIWFSERFAEKLPFGYPNEVSEAQAAKVSDWYVLGELARHAALSWTNKDTAGAPFANVLDLSKAAPAGKALVLAHQIGIGLKEGEVDNPRRRGQQYGMFVKGDGSGVVVRGIVYDASGEVYEIPFADKVDWRGWRYTGLNLIDAAKLRNEGGDKNGVLDFPVTLKYLVFEKQTAGAVKISFEEPSYERPLLPRIEVGNVDSPDKAVPAQLSLANPTDRECGAFLTYRVTPASGEGEPVAEGVSPLLTAKPGRRATFQPEIKVAAPGIYRIEVAVNNGFPVQRCFAVGDAKALKFAEFLSDLEKRCGAYRFAPDGKDKPLTSGGKPITPGQVGELYGNAVRVLSDGTDVTSWKYCGQQGYGDDRMLPRAFDLSDEAGWPVIYVPFGTLAIDPKFGRFKFSEGDNDEVAMVGIFGCGFGVHGCGFIVHGDFVYVSSGEGTNTIIDITDPAHPVKASAISNYYFHRVVIPYKQYGFINTSHRGVVCVDNLANPYRPGPVRGLSMDLGEQGRLTRVFEDKDLAYMSNGKIIDITDPVGVKLVKTSDDLAKFNAAFYPEGTDLAYAEFEPAHLADPFGAMGIYDLSNPLQPKKLGAFAFPQSASRKRDGTYVASPGTVHEFSEGKMIIQLDNTFHVYDVKDPLKPERLSAIQFVDEPRNKGQTIPEPPDEVTTVFAQPARVSTRGAAVHGKYLYVTDGRNVHGDSPPRNTWAPARLYVVDMSGKKPEVAYVHQEELPSEFRQIEYAKGHLFIDDFCFGMWIFSIKDPAKPIKVASVLTAGEGRQAGYVSDKNIAVFSHTFDGTIQLADMTDPERPKELGTLWEGCVHGYWTRYQGKGDTLYVNKGYQLQIIDIRDPMKPSKIGAFKTPDGKDDIRGQIAAKGDVAVVSASVDRKYSLFTYDITDERDPKSLGSVECPGGYPYLNGDYAYLIAPRGTVMAKVDISDPKQPKVTATFDLKDILRDEARLGWGFCVGKGYAFSPTTTGIHHRDYFHVLDVRERNRIIYAGRPYVPEDASPYYWADFWGDAAVAGDILSLGNYGYVTVLNVADPLKPKLLAKKNFGCQWSTGTIRGGMLYVVNLKGLYAIDIPNSSQVPTGKVTVELK